MWFGKDDEITKEITKEKECYVVYYYKKERFWLMNKENSAYTGF